MLSSSLVFYHRIVTAASLTQPVCGWGPIGVITGATTALAGVGAVATGFIDPVADFTPPPAFQTTATNAANASATNVNGSSSSSFSSPLESLGASILWCRRPLSAFLVPGLVEEVIWRAALLPVPAMTIVLSTDYPKSVVDVARHAVAMLTAAGTTSTSMTTTTISPPVAKLYQHALMVLFIHIASHPVFSALAYPRGRQVFGDARFLVLAGIVLGGTTLSYIVSGGSLWAAVLTHSVPVALWRDVWGGEVKLRRGETENSDKKKKKNN